MSALATNKTKMDVCGEMERERGGEYFRAGGVCNVSEK